MSVELWACEAYGRSALQYGMLCFFAATDARTCATHAQCHAMMNMERERVWRRLHELAAAGDEDWADVLGDLDGPQDLLRASDAELP